MKRILTAILLFALPVQAGQTTRFTLPAERMRGCTWADDFRSQTSCEDNGGTVTGTPTFSPSQGVTLDGTTDYIQYDLCGHEFNTTDQSFVVRFTPHTEADEAADRYLFDADSGAGSRIYFYHDSTGNTWNLSLGGTLISSIAEAVVKAAWRKDDVNVLVISGTPGDTSVWLNSTNILDGDGTVYIADSDVIRLTVGARYNGVSRFDGTIHEIRFFAAKLTADEAEDYWDQTTYHYLNAATAVYQMRTEDHDAGNHLTLDSTGNGNHLTLGDGVGGGEPTKLTHKDGYSFDGVDDYLDDWPSESGTETVVYVWNGPGSAQSQSESGRTIQGLLETAGDFSGEIEWLGIFPQALTQIQKYDLAVKLRGGTYTVPGQTILYDDQSTLDTTTLEIACTAGKAITVHWGDGTSTAWVCDGVRNAVNHDYSTEGQYAIRIVGDLLDVTQIKCIETHAYGDIANFSGLTSLTYLYLYKTGVTGTLADISELTSLTSLTLSSTGVTGTLADISGLTSLTSLSLSNTGVTGTLADISGLTSLTYLYLYNTGVTGNLASIRPLTSLTTCHLYDTNLTYTSAGALPAWPGANFDWYSCGLDSGEVDAVLNDFDDDLTGAAGDLRLDGTNANRTAASDAACIAITTDGWGLHVNPDYP